MNLAIVGDRGNIRNGVRVFMVVLRASSSIIPRVFFPNAMLMRSELSNLYYMSCRSHSAIVVGVRRLAMFK